MMLDINDCRFSRMGALAWGACLFAVGCISTESNVLDATEGCDELQEGTIASLDLDPKATEYIGASAEVSAATDRVSAEVYTACAGLATDLGAEDTWSGEDALSARISNDADTGACDVALKEVEAQMTEASEIGVDVVLAVAEGECHVDFDAQRDCDASCAAGTTCEPGSFESRCAPGAISAICSGACSIGSTCVGSVAQPANCMGRCESTCVGECKGTCYHENGQVTQNDPNCMGRCASSCNGLCRGQCKVEQPIACGTEIRCRGTCEGTIESPMCTTEFDPPECQVDIPCYEACAADIASRAECAPTHVTVCADVQASPDLQPLVAALEEYMPPLIDAAEAEGELMQSAGTRMTDAGRDLHERVEDLDGKSLACVGAASAELADSVDALAISVEASVAFKTTFDVEGP